MYGLTWLEIENMSKGDAVQDMFDSYIAQCSVNPSALKRVLVVFGVTPRWKFGNLDDYPALRQMPQFKGIPDIEIMRKCLSAEIEPFARNIASKYQGELCCDFTTRNAAIDLHNSYVELLGNIPYWLSEPHLSKTSNLYGTTDMILTVPYSITDGVLHLTEIHMYFDNNGKLVIHSGLSDLLALRVELS